jgi:enoyl-CoA hydratase/carnithine racemase
MEFVIYEVRDRIARITMNRPDKLNAINPQMRAELFEAFEDVEQNPDVWLAIITGTGRSFSVGHDLVSMAGRAHPGGGPGERTTDDLYLYLSQFYKPVIAAINGICIAQGAGLALLSDIRIAADTAQFGWPQVKRGISSMSGPCLLTHEVPHNVAMELLMTGDFIGAQDALRLNLVNRVVPPDELMATAEAMAAKIRDNAPLAVRGIKEATLRGRGVDLAERLKIGRAIANRVEVSADGKEGLAAFKEKRAPNWTGA